MAVRVAPRVRLRAPEPDDEGPFLDAVRASRRLHRPWVHAPETAEAWQGLLRNSATPRQVTWFAIERESGGIAGCFTLSEIVRGPFQSAYLGFYALVPHAGRGLISEALRLVVARAFTGLRLHRVEANIQPGNERSLALVRRCGFGLEGFSPRYLRIGGRWRDHERHALLVEDWRRLRREAGRGGTR